MSRLIWLPWRRMPAISRRSRRRVVRSRSGPELFVADEAALNEIVGGFAISDTAANIQANLAALAADASHITSITATGGTVTVGTGVFVADAAALNEIVGGFAISDTAANVQANLAALTADASKITSITVTGGTVTVGTGAFVADAAALNEIVGGFAISDTAANVQANLTALAADANHITSITATSGTVTVGTGVFVADAAALNEIVGGFAISDTAANVQANLAALAADASQITSITATGGTVTVGTGVFAADAAALNEIVGGFAISDTAANVQSNLAALTADASHITSITATGGTVTVGTGVFAADAAALNEIVGGFAFRTRLPMSRPIWRPGDVSHITSITATVTVTVGTGLFPPMQRRSTRLLVGCDFNTAECPGQRLHGRRSNRIDHSNGWYVTAGLDVSRARRSTKLCGDFGHGGQYQANWLSIRAPHRGTAGQLMSGHCRTGLCAMMATRLLRVRDGTSTSCRRRTAATSK